MPWTAADVDKHKKGLSPAQKAMWVKVANKAAKACKDKGGEDASCEKKAIAQANAVAGRFTAAEWTKSYINDLPDTAFLHISKDGERNYPYRDDTGTINVSRLRRSLTAIKEGEDDGLSPSRRAALIARVEKMIEEAQKAVEPTAEMFAEELPSTTMWVGLWLPEEAAGDLAVADGEPPANMHITMAFFGDLADLPDDAPERAKAALEAFSWQEVPLDVNINGVARFESTSASDGKDVLYATVDSQRLWGVRQMLCEAFYRVGLYPSTLHEYIPHVTLAYLEHDAAAPSLVPPNMPVTFDKITLRAGATTSEYMLRGNSFSHGMMVPEGYTDLADACSDSGESRLFIDIKAFAETPGWIAVLPTPGKYKHPTYGEIRITKERNARFVDNFINQIYQEHIPIDAEHETKLSGALGYIKEMRQQTNGSVEARIEWTDRGTALIEADRFKYVSPEWFDFWKDPATEVEYADVLIGAALCTRPFFKDQSLRPLVASEKGLFAPDGEQTEDSPIFFTSLVPVVEATSVIMEAKVTVDPTKVADPTPVDAPSAQAFSEMRAQMEAHRLTAESNATALKQASDRIQAMESDARRRKFTDTVMGRGDAGDGRRWFGEVDKHVNMLEKLSVAFGEESEEVKHYVAQNRAAAEQISQSNLFSEAGTSGSGATSDDPSAKLEALIVKAMSEDKIDRSAATSKVAAANPALYQAHRKAVEVRV